MKMKSLQSDINIEQIMYHFTKENYGNIAFLIHENTIYFSRHTHILKSPTTAITKLIQGVYDSYPEKSHFILRNKIYSSAIPTEMCLGMIKVAAKRCKAPLKGKNHHILIPFNMIEILYQSNNSIDNNLQNKLIQSNNLNNNTFEFLKLIKNLSFHTIQKKERYESNRKVACILVSENKQILSIGLNENSKNKTKHAEINLVQNYYKKYNQPIPKNSIIYTTLKPCKMCAGMIWSCAQDVSLIKVFFLHDDPGSYARNTVLNCGTAERKRAAQNRNELSIVIEEKITIEN
jgi:tRNA(Arg) A34 adenosine deaminase TadA